MPKSTTLFIGMDVHKETIDVAIATNRLNGKVRHYGQIQNRIDAIDKLVARLKREASSLKFVYEAGPTGFGLYRHLTRKQHQCVVVAPSLIPRKPGDRVKTDRRDAMRLAQLYRAGDLTPVYVPDVDDGPSAICPARVSTNTVSYKHGVRSCNHAYVALQDLTPLFVIHFSLLYS